MTGIFNKTHQDKVGDTPPSYFIIIYISPLFHSTHSSDTNYIDKTELDAGESRHQ